MLDAAAYFEELRNKYPGHVLEATDLPFLVEETLDYVYNGTETTDGVSIWWEESEPSVSTLVGAVLCKRSGKVAKLIHQVGKIYSTDDYIDRTTFGIIFIPQLLQAIECPTTQEWFLDYAKCETDEERVLANEPLKEASEGIPSTREGRKS